MTMEVDVKTVGFDISPFESGGVIGPETRARIMQILAVQVVKIIRQRVYMGKTPAIPGHGDGTTFLPYEPEYERQKSGKGRKTGTKGDWLWVTGQMLGSMKPLYFDGDRFLVGFDSGRGDGKSNALIAWVHDTVGVGKKKKRRPFFRLSEEEQAQAWERAIAQARQEGLI
jgi:hypothetical protein